MLWTESITMKRKVLTLLLLGALVLAGARGIQRFHAKHPRLQTHYPSASIQSQHLSTYKIGISDILDSDEKGHCSATAVGPHTLLTAGHCDLNTNKLTLGEEVVTILSVMPDGNDHVLYIVDHTFVNYSQIDQKEFAMGESVHYWGNPKKLQDVYRDGVFAGTEEDEDLPNQKFILCAVPGDSGAGIFDAQGHVVAVISMGDGCEELSLPLSFTKEQLAAIK